MLLHMLTRLRANITHSCWTKKIPVSQTWRLVGLLGKKTAQEAEEESVCQVGDILTSVQHLCRLCSEAVE